MIMVCNIDNKTIEIDISLENEIEGSLLGESGAPNEHYTN